MIRLWWTVWLRDAVRKTNPQKWPLLASQSSVFGCLEAPSWVIQLSLNVLLVMDCVTARCGSQGQPTKMTLACQWVLSSSEFRASNLEHGGSWVRVPSGAQIFSVSSYGWFFKSPFNSFIKSMNSRFFENHAVRVFFSPDDNDNVAINSCLQRVSTTHFDYEDDYRTGCRNVNHATTLSHSGLLSPGRSCSTVR